MKIFLLSLISIFVISVYGQEPPKGTFNENAAPTATFVSGDTTVCDGASAYLRIELTDGPTWTVEYDDGSDTISLEIEDSVYILTVSPSETTTYTLVSVSNSTCSGDIVYGPSPKSGDVTVTINPLPTLSISDVSMALCHGSSDGSATVNVLSGMAPYTYAWDGGVYQQATDPHLNAGLHNVAVTDDNGCTAFDSVTIGEPDELQIAGSSVTDVNCNGESSGAITIIPIGGTPNYHYSWNTGDTTQAISGLEAGNYSATVTDENGCETVTDPEIEVKQLDSPVSIIEQEDIVDVTCHDGNNGEATVHASGGTNSFTYLWSNGQTSDHATGLVAGTYTVTVTDDNGCTHSSTAVVSEPDELVASFSSTNVVCDGSELGSASIDNVSGGTAPYSYDWGGGNTNSSVSDLDVGTYVVTLTDANGCPATDYPYLFTISQDPMPSVDISASNSGVSCGGDPVDLTAVGSGGGTYIYQWSTGQTDSTITVNPTATTTYYVTVTNSYGSMCSVVDSIEVEVNTLPIVVFSPDPNVCENVTQVNLSSYLTVTGGTLSSVWYEGVGTNTDGVLDPSQLTPGMTYMYKVHGVDNGCDVVDSAEITIRTLPNVQLDLTPSEVCLSAGEVQLSGESPSGGYFVGDGVDSTGLFNTDLVGSGMTPIQYFYTDTFGCANSALSELNVVAPQTVSINLPSTDICSGEGMIDVTVSQAGGDARIYGPGISTNGIPLTGDGNYVFYLDPSTLDGDYYMVYNLTVTACGGTDTVDFTVHPTPDVFISFPADINNLSDTVDYEISFTAGAHVTVDGQTLYGNVFSGAVWHIGQHEIVVSVDDGYCVGKDSITVIVNGIDGIEDIDMSSLISIYPNPVNDVLNIEMGGVDVSEIQIINAMGQVVYQNEINSDVMSVDVSDFVSGIYFVRFIDGASVSEAVKIIKR